MKNSLLKKKSKMQKSRNTNTYICLYLHKISRRIDKKLIDMLMCIVNNTETDRIKGKFLLFSLIHFLFIFKPCEYERKKGAGREGRKGGRKKWRREERGGPPRS